MVTYEERPVTQRWGICDNCGHSAIASEYEAWWGVKCDVCGKEGCDKCLNHGTFWVGEREYHRHTTCKWTKKQEKLKEKYRLSNICCEKWEPDHIC